MVKKEEKVKGNTRVPGEISAARIPFTMTVGELEEFDKARAKKYPLVTRSTVIRDLIAKFVRETGTK